MAIRFKQRLPRVALATLVAIVSFSGCLSHPSSDSSPFDLLDAHCDSEAECASLGSRVVDGSDSSFSSLENGVRIHGFQGVHIKNLSLTKPNVGIEWTLDSSCNQCTLLIERSAIRAVEGGVRFDVPNGTVIIRDSIIDVRSTESGPHDSFGVSVANGVRIELENVTLNGRSGTGILAGLLDEFSVDARHVSINGFELGLRGALDAVSPGPIGIACGRVGILATGGQSQFLAEGITANGCSDFGMYLASQRAVVIRNVRVANSSIGIEIPSAPEVSLVDVELFGNGYGIQSWYGSAGRFSMTGSLVEANDELGLNLQPEFLSISDSRFRFNGASAGRYSVPAAEFPGAIFLHNFLPEAEWAIFDSTFEENLGYAITNEGLAPVLDARGNWWGSPAGPALELAGGPSVPVGVGSEVVRGPALVHPALDAPP